MALTVPLPLRSWFVRSIALGFFLGSILGSIVVVWLAAVHDSFLPLNTSLGLPISSKTLVNSRSVYCRPLNSTPVHSQVPSSLRNSSLTGSFLGADRLGTADKGAATRKAAATTRTTRGFMVNLQRKRKGRTTKVGPRRG